MQRSFPAIGAWISQETTASWDWARGSLLHKVRAAPERVNLMNRQSTWEAFVLYPSSPGDLAIWIGSQIKQLADPRGLSELRPRGDRHGKWS